MRRRAFLTAIASFVLAGPGAAQEVVTSAAPGQVAVTVYRDPGRGLDDAMNLRWLDGFALITERRRVTLPAGESILRFEGVAAGIVPQSAIITGLPDGIVERNRDAYLLSPSALIDRSLGERVTLRRTETATGAVREQEAIVRSSANGALVVESRDGIEALRCTGLAEALVYHGVPEGLSPRPTLSIRARASQPVEAEVTLAYLATGFDWQANYIAQLSDDGEHMDLFAWLTLASTDETSFRDADTQAVAGQVNYSRAAVPSAEGGAVSLRCWPQGRTNDVPLDAADVAPPPPSPPPPAMAPMESAIVVTGARMPAPAQIAQQEDLGDLKLYRIPEPVTIAANSQKQVALLQRQQVRITTVYRRQITAESDGSGAPNRIVVTRNTAREGLGLPLPMGQVALFADHRDRPVLLGEGALADRAVGQDVEIDFGAASGLWTRLERLERDGQATGDYVLTVTSDHPRPVRFEALFDRLATNPLQTRTRLGVRDGRQLWAVTIPANGTVTLRYRVAPERDR